MRLRRFQGRSSRDKPEVGKRMLEIVWTNPARLAPTKLLVTKLVSGEMTGSQLWSLYRSVSEADEAEVFYELLISVSDPICAA